MSSTDKREIKKLLEWAEKHEKKSLIVNEEERESFWKIRKQESTDIMPYGFRTIQEFEKICNLIYENEENREMQRTISIAAFSSREDYERSRAQRERAMDKMPEYIYAF